jgi:signal transduction histidine kinase
MAAHTPTPSLTNAWQQQVGQRRSALLFLGISYLLWAAVTLRWIGEYLEQDHPLTWLVSLLLGLFGVLLGLEPWLTRGSPARAHLYLLFQTSLVLVASLFYYELDFFALLYVPLTGQAVFLFPRRAAFAWVAILVLATFVGQLFQFRWPGGLPFFLLYAAGILFVAAFATLTLQAQAERERSEALLAELQQAHRQLQAYAGQAEELATANERNRLARELHDSVAQTLYGLTLQAEAAARRLKAGQVDAAAASLDEIGLGARETLQETRLLIFELRPPVLEEQGLAAALRARLEAVESRSGQQVQAEIADPGPLPPALEMGLYRIAQEALNNSLRHGQAGQVRVYLGSAGGRVTLEVSDDGLGFDSARQTAGGLGLQSMRERAAQIGGSLQINSTPGSGTTIRVEASAAPALEQEAAA